VTFKYSPRWQEMSTLFRQDPEAFYALMEDRERQLETYLDFGPQTYTPVLIGTGGVNPNLGSTGYAAGIFTATGRKIEGVFEISFAGVGVTAGTGSYNVTMPLPISHFTTASGSAINQINPCEIFDNPTHLVAFLQLSAAFGDDRGRLVAAAGSAGATVPWAGGPVAGDFIRGRFAYWLTQ